MILSIYDSDIIRRADRIEYKTAQWDEYYNADFGRCILTVSNTRSNWDKFAYFHWLKHDKSATPMQILYKEISADGSKIEIISRGGLKRLDGRAILDTLKISNVEQGIYAMLAQNVRGMTKLTAHASAGFPEILEHEITGGSVYDGARDLAIEAGFGLRVNLLHQSMTNEFEVYNGVNRRFSQSNPNAMLFSDDRKNLANITYSDDWSGIKNVAYVRGEGKAGERIIEIVGDAVGDDRFELDVDARDLRWETDMTEPQYLDNLMARGLMKLSEHNRLQNFSGIVRLDGYGTRFGLGDIVTCRSVMHGIQVDTRITKSTITSRDNTDMLTLTFGEQDIRFIKRRIA